MPQTLSEEEATTKICPFISGRLPGGPTTSHCLGSHCACWGWHDDHEGQPLTETVTLTEHQRPQGDGWTLSDAKPGKDEFIYIRFNGNYGPRRGQCEAMSPYIEVNTT